MLDYPLGVSSWSFTSLLTDEQNRIVTYSDPCPPEELPVIRKYFSDMVDAILGSKIETVELWYSEIFRDAEVMGQIRRLSAAGRVGSLHSSGISDPKDGKVPSRIEQAGLLAELGGRTLIVHTNDPDVVRKIADGCVDRGIVVCPELLPFDEGKDKACTAGKLLDLLVKADRPNVSVCLDLNHVFPHDRLIPTIYELGPVIETIHVADYNGEKDSHWMPLTGVNDWPAIACAFNEIEYPGPFMYEVRFEARDAAEIAAKIEENFRTLKDISSPG